MESVSDKAIRLVDSECVNQIPDVFVFSVAGDHNDYIVTIVGGADDDQIREVFCTCRAGRDKKFCSHSLACSYIVRRGWEMRRKVS